MIVAGESTCRNRTSGMRPGMFSRLKKALGIKLPGKNPRTYKKKLEEYCSVGIKTNRNKWPRLCNTEEVLDETERSEDTSTRAPAIILSRLKEMGIKTRVRKLSRLLDIYDIALQSH